MFELIYLLHSCTLSCRKDEDPIMYGELAGGHENGLPLSNKRPLKSSAGHLYRIHCVHDRGENQNQKPVLDSAAINTNCRTHLSVSVEAGPLHTAASTYGQQADAGVGNWNSYRDWREGQPPARGFDRGDRGGGFDAQRAQASGLGPYGFNPPPATFPSRHHQAGAFAPFHSFDFSPGE